MTEINISPLIDMVFILLIFFIVTTVFVEEDGMKVSKPESDSAVSLDKDSINFKLSGTQVFLEGRDIGVGNVRSAVNRMIQGRDLPVIINVGKKATAGLLVRVIDESRLGGAEHISLAESK
ncbi:MAG: biopolymer transporter ExbD [Opitutaceae bacterium]|nr:biopolymer transporter ExbD [Opitutaceae bacterium]